MNVGTATVVPIFIFAEHEWNSGHQVQVLEWAAQHRPELMEDWNLYQSRQPPKTIEPLE
jgi:hypothetical protein